MIITKKYFPKIISENDLNYLAHLEGIISSVDELSTLEIIKTNYSYKFRLAPSLPIYVPMLLEEILKLHSLFRIKLDLSKSIKTSSTIVFQINLDSII